jgi:ABC-2 type transport system permease protein
MSWAVRDTWTITRRAVSHWIRRPGPAAVSVLFPILVVLMFNYLLGGQMRVPGGGDYVEFLVPGMFVLTMLFGIETTMVAVNTDALKGITDRFRSLPISSMAVVAGRCLADMLYSLLGLAAILACGVAIGWQWSDGLGDAAVAVVLLLALRFALVWLGIYLGLVARDPQAVVAVQILVWPVGFLSSVFVAPSTMPSWLGATAEWNPISSTATAARELFGNPGFGGSSWIAEHAVLMAIIWPLVITAVFAPLAAQRYRRLGD